MFSDSSFGTTLDIMHRTMDVSLLRRSVIADNIANADTPNFKRSVINFESALKRALEPEGEHLDAKLTRPRHIPFQRTKDHRDVGPRRVLDYLTTSDNNGNNVDLEHESMMMMQNQLRYELMTQFVSSQFARVSSVLR